MINKDRSTFRTELLAHCALALSTSKDLDKACAEARELTQKILALVEGHPTGQVIAALANVLDPMILDIELILEGMSASSIFSEATAAMNDQDSN